MNLKTTLSLGIITLCAVACSDSEETPKVADIAATYNGYSLASCTYFQNSCSVDESIVITENTDGSALVTFSSDTWGTFTINNAQMSENAGVYTLTGDGQTKMGMGDKKSAYDCTCSAVIKSKTDAQITFNVAGVMGGLTLDFFTGKAPAHLLLAGTYKGYSDADCSYFQDRYTDDESLNMTANEDGTLAVVFESATWCTFSVASATISETADGYLLNGTGRVSMGMGNVTSDYDFTMEASIDASKENYSFSFNVPAVMGGLTLTLASGTAPATEQ